MIISAITDLKKICSCCSDNYLNNGDYLTLDGACFFQKSDTTKKLCLTDLNIPIPTDSYESCRLTSGLSQDQSIMLRESFITLIKVDDYKDIWWRYFNPELDQSLTFSYKLKLTTLPSSLLSNPSTLNLGIDFVPYIVSNNITWNNISAVSIFGFPIGTWNSTNNLTWNQLDPTQFANSISLPSSNTTLAIQIPSVSGIFSQEQDITVDFGTFKYQFKLQIDINLNTNYYNISVISVKLRNKYFSNDFYIGTITNTLAVNSNVVSGDIEFSVFSQSVEQFNNLSAFLFLSSKIVMDKIKLLNQSIEKRNYQVLQY
jgi:hypothetical protein